MDGKGPPGKAISPGHGGAAAARNAGIAASRGEYLTFVDSDDYVSARLVGSLVERLLRESGVDACYSGFLDVEDGVVEDNNIQPEKLDYKGEAEIAQFMGNLIANPPQVAGQNLVTASVWANIYDAGLVRENGVRFDTEAASEDLFFNLDFCRHAQHVVILKECNYFYCHNSQSQTQRYWPGRFAATKKMRLMLEKKLEEWIPRYPFLQERIDRNYMDFAMVCMEREMRFKKANGRSYCMRQIKAVVEDEDTRRVLKDYPIGRMPPKQKVLFSMTRRQWPRAVYGLYVVRSYLKKWGIGKWRC